MLSRKNGGAETYCCDAIEALAEAGVEQVLALHPFAGRLAGLAHRGLATGLPGWLPVWPPVARPAIARLIARHRPTVVHCWMRRAAESLPMRHPPAIGWFGGYYDVGRFARCDWFVGVTADLARHIVAGGAPQERTRHIQTFANLATSDGVVARGDLDTPVDATVALVLSRLHPKKAIDVAIRALPACPGLWLWVAGDGELDAELRRLAAHEGVAERVRFLGWRDDRAALLAAADICLLPSRWEPFGTVMIEAWAARVPLIAAAAAGPAATLRDGIDGLLVPIDDVAALAAAIGRVRADPVARAAMVDAGAARYEREFSRPAVVARLVELYEAASSAHRAAS
jgi:hypothetical protein